MNFLNNEGLCEDVKNRCRRDSYGDNYTLLAKKDKHCLFILSEFYSLKNELTL